MSKRLGFLFWLALSLSVEAQLVTSTREGVVLAHRGRISIEGRWDVAGVENPTSIVTRNDKVAVLDALANEAVVVDVETGATTRRKTSESPVAAAFLADELWIAARDKNVVENGSTRIAVAADPAFLAASDARLYVYSRVPGLLQEIDSGRVTRTVAVGSNASDLEISGATAFLAYPREARIRVVDLESMQTDGDVAVGAVPVDLAFAGGGTALTARLLAVADPASKRVWITESTQSTAKAVFRGFLRGFLGLGLFGGRSSQFATGVDRVAIAGDRWVAYDSSSGTLYRFTRKKSSVLATGVAPGAFTLTANGVAWWDGTSVAQVAFDEPEKNVRPVQPDNR